MSNERSFYIINSEEKSKASQIREAIEDSGLKIVKFKAVRPTRALLRALHPNVRQEQFRSILSHLENHECEIGLVEGEDAVEILAEISGRDPFPFRNPIGTLRYRFTGRDTVILDPEDPYPFRAIDCPRDAKEAQKALRRLQLLASF